MGSNVIANDRIRASEDVRIQTSLEVKMDKLTDCMKEMTLDLREIKTKMGIK